MAKIKVHRHYQNTMGANISPGIYDTADERVIQWLAILAANGIAEVIEADPEPEAPTEKPPTKRR